MFLISARLTKTLLKSAGKATLQTVRRGYRKHTKKQARENLLASHNPKVLLTSATINNGTSGNKGEVKFTVNQLI